MTTQLAEILKLHCRQLLFFYHSGKILDQLDGPDGGQTEDRIGKPKEIVDLHAYFISISACFIHWLSLLPGQKKAIDYDP